MKNKIVLFITGCVSLFLSSCLGSDEVEYEFTNDCQITSFSLSSDSIPELKKVVFTIDQLNGRIFNADSMPYGTKLDEKVICTVQLAQTVYTCQVIQEAVGDTIYWNLQDSLDFSKPVKFLNTAFDLETTKTYIAQVNIHQVVPDSMAWSLYSDQITGEAMKEEKVIAYSIGGVEYYYMYVQPANVSKGYQLYCSSASDAKNWNELPLTGLPAGEVNISQITEYEGVLYAATTKGAFYLSDNGQDWALADQAPVVRALLGEVKDGGVGQPSVLAAIVEANGTLTFAGMNKSKTWTLGEVVPIGFPVSGFGNVSYNTMYRERLMVLAGKDKEGQLLNMGWSTTTATSWTLLTDEEATYFDKREGVMLTKYDDKFFMIGGINAAGKASKDIYTSIDGGVSWMEQDTLIVLPEAYKARGFSSVQVNKEKYMLIFGGKESNNSNVLDQIWRGRINRLGFKD